jgi:hypothetical protein
MHVPQHDRIGIARNYRRGRRAHYPFVEHIQPLLSAPILSPDAFPARSVIGKLASKGVTQLFRICPVVNRLRNLLSAKRDQHTEDDDPHLADERAPTMKRLGKVKVHAARPLAFES